MTDEQAWELCERLSAQAPEGVRYEMARTERPTFPQKQPPPQLELGQNVEPVTPWYVRRVVLKSEA